MAQKKFIINNQKGTLLLEVLFSIAIIMLITAPLIKLIISSRQNWQIASKTYQAGLLAEEGIAAIQNIHEHDYTLITDGSFGLNLAQNWNLTNTAEQTGSFTRQIDISTINPDLKMAMVKVSWPKSKTVTGSLVLRTYLVSPRIIANPVNPINPINPQLASCLNLDGGQNALDVESYDTHAFVITDSASESFVVVDITDSANMKEIGRVNLQNNPKALTRENNLAFIASKHNFQELQVIDIANPPSSNLIGSYDAGNQTDANAVAIKDQYVLLGREKSSADEFYIINIADPSKPEIVSQLDLNYSVKKIEVVDNLAYLATDSTSSDIAVIDLSNLAQPTVIKTIDLSGESNLLSLFYYNNYLFAGSASGLLSIINLNDNSITTLQIQGALNDLTLIPDKNILIAATDNNAAAIQYLDLTDLANPKLVNQLTFAATINSLSYNQSQNLIYFTTNANDQEICAAKF